jgi:hypothetical protein
MAWQYSFFEPGSSVVQGSVVELHAFMALMNKPNERPPYLSIDE